MGGIFLRLDSAKEMQLAEFREHGQQSNLFSLTPRHRQANRAESLDDYVTDTKRVRIFDVLVDELGLVNLGFEGAIRADAGRPAYHP